ncbi:hypothetical protein ABEB36_001821 [Hypothenemus hampei]|uniref:Uncharacterized protein n=1 Tax=Hypothenemus hampei TaxID=57062 RepID=A0ABD1FHS3_HYPHA
MELSIIIFSVFFFFLFSGTGEAYSALIQRQTTTNNNNKLTTQELIELLETVPDEGKNKFIKDNVNLGFKIEFLKEPWVSRKTKYQKRLKNKRKLIFCFCYYCRKIMTKPNWQRKSSIIIWKIVKKLDSGNC